jgi:hypothetical protein
MEPRRKNSRRRITPQFAPLCVDYSEVYQTLHLINHNQLWSSTSQSTMALFFANELTPLRYAF